MSLNVDNRTHFRGEGRGCKAQGALSWLAANFMWEGCGLSFKVGPRNGTRLGMGRRL